MFFWLQVLTQSSSHYQATFHILVMMDMHLISTDNLDIKYPLIVYQVTNVHFVSQLSVTHKDLLVNVFVATSFSSKMKPS